MKEKEVLVENKEHPLIVYVEKEDKTYGPVISGALASGEHLDDFFYKKRNIEKDLLNRLIKGEITPVFYYMTIFEISVAELAVRVGISRRRVKKHFAPKYFSRIGLSLLGKYAEVFDVPAANMLQVVLIKQDSDGESYRTYTIKDSEPEKIIVEQSETDNPMLSIMKIGELR